MRNRVVRLRQVVVSDDEVEPELTCAFGFSESPHAGIDSDDEPDSIGICGFKHRGLEAVALTQAMRDMKLDYAVEHFNCSFQ